MEGWGSGLSQQFAKLPVFYQAHRFESCTFRLDESLHMPLQFEIVKAKMLDLSFDKIMRLRAMTLPKTESEASYMRDTLDDPNVLKLVSVAIAQFNDEDELGWSMIRPYHGLRLLQVFIKPEYRRMKLGTKLFKALDDGNRVTAIAWNKRSNDFFSSLNIHYTWV